MFILPNFIIWLLTLFAYPYVSYAIGFKLADAIVWQLLLAVVVFFVVGLVWTIAVKLYSYITNEIFTIFIDVIPGDDRNKEEAKAVVFGGQFVIDLLNYGKNIRLADDALIERLASDGFFSIFFSEKRKERLYAIRDYYLDMPDETPSEWQSNRVLDRLGLTMPIFETVLTNALYRGFAIQTLVFLLLLIFHPAL